MVRLAMIYDTSNDGMTNHPIMSVELNERVTNMLREKEIEIGESTVFVGNSIKFQIEDIGIEIKTSRIRNDNGIMRQLSAPKG